MELVDCHTHTRYSDGRPTIEENVEAALRVGLTTMACTDHFVLPPSMDPNCEVSIRAEDVDSYSSDIRLAREKHPEIEIVHGFECDFYPGCEEYITRYRGASTFLLGSVHALDGEWIDDLSDLTYWDKHDTAYVWRRYFEVWCEACFCPVGFSSMAHPDLVSLLGRYPDDEGLVHALYSQAATAAREAGVHIEVSSAGLRKPVGRYYPHPDLLARFAHAAVPITVGSDAHDSQLIGDHIHDLYRFAFEAGYREVDVPCADGGWRRIPLA